LKSSMPPLEISTKNAHITSRYNFFVTFNCSICVEVRTINLQYFMGWGNIHKLILVGLRGDVKDLLFTLPDLSTLNQSIAQVIRCANKLFEHWQNRCHELLSTTQRSFALLATQKNFPLIMLAWPSATSLKDDPMQINKTIQTPCRVRETTLMHKWSLFILWKTKSCCSWVSKEAWITCDMCHFCYQSTTKEIEKQAWTQFQ
jgi:hypothetical protein